MLRQCQLGIRFLLEKTSIRWLVLTLLGALLSGCDSQSRELKVGVVNYLPTLEPTLFGFKQGLLDLGYIENETIHFLYSGSVGPGLDEISAEVERLVMQEKVDLLLTMGTVPTKLAKQITQQQAHPIPVIFAPLINPVETGLIKSLGRPGQNITGVHNANTTEKTVEWLLRLAPHTEYFFTFYHPDDVVSSIVIEDLAAIQEFYYPVLFRPIAVNSQQAALDALQSLPHNSSLLITPTPSLGAMDLLQEAAMAQGVFVAGYNVPVTYTLMSYSVNGYQQGYQASKLADRIIRGADPGMLAVESAESYLSLNLANANGHHFYLDPKFLKLSDNILR